MSLDLHTTIFTRLDNQDRVLSRLEKNQDELHVVVNGDGNGNRGLVRKIDALSQSDRDRTRREEEEMRVTRDSRKQLQRVLWAVVLSVVTHGIITVFDRWVLANKAEVIERKVDETNTKIGAHRDTKELEKAIIENGTKSH